MLGVHSADAASAGPSMSSDNAGEEGGELEQLIGSIAKELQMDVEKAVADLMKDKDIAQRLAQIKDRSGKGISRSFDPKSDRSYFA